MATASAPVVRTSVAKVRPRLDRVRPPLLPPSSAQRPLTCPNPPQSVFLAARNGQVHELISLLDATQPNPPVAVQEEEVLPPSQPRSSVTLP